jgi:Kyakuja-Dileera-Zisupton transposase
VSYNVLVWIIFNANHRAKYALAITNELLDTFDPGLMCGYDIGCSFSTTANNSVLLGPKLREHRGRFCVGSFHGHAHCQLCQLDWHPLYLKGCGLEDFETCERVFSCSNALASSTRHASTFHRRQLIL